MLFCCFVDLLFCRLPILTTKPLNHKTTKPQTYIDVCLNVQIYEKKAEPAGKPLHSQRILLYVVYERDGRSVQELQTMRVLLPSMFSYTEDNLLLLCINSLNLLTYKVEVVTETLHLAIHLIDEGITLLTCSREEGEIVLISLQLLLQLVVATGET